MSSNVSVADKTSSLKSLIKKWLEELDCDRNKWFRWNTLNLDSRGLDYGRYEPDSALRKRKKALEYEAYGGAPLMKRLTRDGTVAADEELLERKGLDGAVIKVSKSHTTEVDGGGTKSVAIRSDDLGSDGKRTAGNSLIQIKLKPRRPKPLEHPEWALDKVISGHVGWVRAVVVDYGNEWFASGGGDRMVKIWDLATGHLKLSLTGHISAIRGLAVSRHNPYLFSVGEDKMVKCWDLETNKVTRQFHGHLSGVFCVALQEDQNLLITGGRDSCVRVWDVRSRSQVFALTGHASTVATVVCRDEKPEIISGSMDSTIRLWDLRAGKSFQTLTHHKKAVRSIVNGPQLESSEFCSASADSLRQFSLQAPKADALQAEVMHVLSSHTSIINTLAVNDDGVLFSGGDDGSMQFWDWRSGLLFQNGESVAQPGSLAVENGIFCSTFDVSGSRLITGEADKTIKIWKEFGNT